MSCLVYTKYSSPWCVKHNDSGWGNIIFLCRGWLIQKIWIERRATTPNAGSSAIVIILWCNVFNNRRFLDFRVDIIFEVQVLWTVHDCFNRLYSSDRGEQWYECQLLSDSIYFTNIYHHGHLFSHLHMIKIRNNDFSLTR